MNSRTEQGQTTGDDGSTDWEQIFEGEADGLIPEIQRANTPFVIKEFATIIFQQLFLRENDSMSLMKYVIALDQIIPDAREKETDKWVIMEMRDSVIKLLRKIKTERIARAKAKSHIKDPNQQERRLAP